MKTISLLITLCLYTSMFSQKTGEVQYEMYVKFINFRPYSASLLFNTNSAEYLYQDKNTELQQASNEGKIDIKIPDNDKYTFITDKRKDSIFYISKKGYYVKERIPKIKWNLKEGKKKIGGILCHKAITKFRGRNYVAWYAPSIPSSFGPWKLGGLPGLILQAHDDKELIVFNFKSIRFPTKKRVKSINSSFKRKELLVAVEESYKRDQQLIEEFYAKEKERGSFKSTITLPTRMELNYNDILVRNRE